MAGYPAISSDYCFGRIWDKIPDHAWIVTYCDGETCSLSEDLARELVSMGYEKVRVLSNGWTRWREAGLPIHRELQSKREADYG
jgi:3-mercaptopyruvate sulfurtransferase SseA